MGLFLTYIIIISFFFCHIAYIFLQRRDKGIENFFGNFAQINFPVYDYF